MKSTGDVCLDLSDSAQFRARLQAVSGKVRELIALAD